MADKSENGDDTRKPAATINGNTTSIEYGSLGKSKKMAIKQNDDDDDDEEFGLFGLGGGKKDNDDLNEAEYGEVKGDSGYDSDYSSPHDRRHHPRRRRNNNKNNNFELLLGWGMLILTTVIVIVGLLVYRNQTLMQHKQEIMNAAFSGSFNPIVSGSTTKATEPAATVITATTTETTARNHHDNAVIYKDVLAREHWNPNPFDLYPITESKNAAAPYGTPFAPAPIVTIKTSYDNDSDNDNDNDNDNDGNMLGYLMQPNIVNNTLLFVSEGDIYLTSLNNHNNHNTNTIPSFLPAMKLTTTVGNVRTPVLHPYLPIIAYTATYTGRRDIYILDLRSNKKPAMRLTYWSHGAFGVSSVIGWRVVNNTDKDETTTTTTTNTRHILTFSADSSAVSLPDKRLYEITVALEEEGHHNEGASSNNYNKNGSNGKAVVLQTKPVPLAQAIDAAVDNQNNCYYFTRTTQSSHTFRYVGGTVESLWKWCQNDDDDDDNDNDNIAVPFTQFYNGTSKSPQIYQNRYLLFLSDRSITTQSKNNKKVWIPSTMNLWALPLSSITQHQRDEFIFWDDFIQLTQVSCHFNGKSLMEYSIDPITDNVILRIGADLYILSSNTIQKKMSQHGEERNRRMTKRNLDAGDNEEEEEVGVDESKFSNNDINSANSKMMMVNKNNKNNSNNNNNNNDKIKNKKNNNKNNKNSNMNNNKNNDDDNKNIKSNNIKNENKNSDIMRLPIAVYSDFHEHQERIIPASLQEHVSFVDIYETAYDSLSVLLTLRGQTWVVPVVSDTDPDIYDDYYQGAGMNIPQRRYRVVPGNMMGGSVRVITASYVPLPIEQQEAGKSSTTTSYYDRARARNRRLAIILATDPLSPTSEQAFYMIETQSDAIPTFLNSFTNTDNQYNFPTPLVGGHVNGGSTKEGGLGTILKESVQVSPCGRRIGWIDTDGRICVMTLPLDSYYKYQPNYYYDQLKRYNASTSNKNTTTNAATPPLRPGPISYTVLTGENEYGESMLDPDAIISWSPGGRYLAVEHNAKNQFTIITIVDCGNPNKNGNTSSKGNNNSENTNNNITASKFSYNSKIEIGRMVQVTPDRFNSYSPYWGKSTFDMYEQQRRESIKGATDECDANATNATVIDKKDEEINEEEEDDVMNPATSTLYFLTDRDIVNDVNSPWGNRAPSPHFPKSFRVYGLPLLQKKKDVKGQEGSLLTKRGQFSGGGAAELYVEEDLILDDTIEILSTDQTTGVTTDKEEKKKAIEKDHDDNDDSQEDDHDDDDKDGADDKDKDIKDGSVFQDVEELSNPYPQDPGIDFGSNIDFEFGRHAYRLASIPHAYYKSILAQTDDGSFVLTKVKDGKHEVIEFFEAEPYPSDIMSSTEVSSFLKLGMVLIDSGLSTTRDHMYFIFGGPGAAPPGGTSGGAGSIKVVPTTGLQVQSLLVLDEKVEKNIADTGDIGLSVWPQLEYEQMYNDAWRMVRDYYYDIGMTGIDWSSIHKRYKPLVKRCAKREELDDVLEQMASELSALHIFVYGGEYNEPVKDDETTLKHLYEPANLGVEMTRNPKWHGYEITSIAERDPDYNVINGGTKGVIYSPLHESTLSLSGQKGLQVGDVIIAINGDSVMYNCPDVNMLLRGKAGQSIRLDVLRLNSSKKYNNIKGEAQTTPAVIPESVIAVPLSTKEARELRYQAWEWKTRQLAKALAQDAGFTVGYIHLRQMGKEDENAFVRGFFEDYNKETMIIDVRHNSGGNIDSWILDTLQRKAWQYFFGRVKNVTNGGLGWDEQFAFRGHIIVLLDEKTSSDGEGFSRGVSELGLGKLLGTRTWGGGIWLAQDNLLVDGGIVTAPDMATYNNNFGWGLGIEQMGVTPDIIVDNNPRTAFDGTDTQLIAAIEVLKQWLIDEPVVLPKPETRPKDMSYEDTELSCSM